jgi:hypothetical protein
MRRKSKAHNHEGHEGARRKAKAIDHEGHEGARRKIKAIDHEGQRRGAKEKQALDHEGQRRGAKEKQALDATTPHRVIPAQAGIHCDVESRWVLACARLTSRHLCIAFLLPLFFLRVLCVLRVKAFELDFSSV